MTSARRLLDDCFLHDKDRLRHDEVLALLKERLSPIASVRNLPLEQAHRLVLAEDVAAPRNIPAHTNAAVDGYAVRAADLNADGMTRLKVTERVAAGDTRELALEAGAAARIFTGARMPGAADTVFMQEDCESDGQAVEVPSGIKPGANVRAAGEDFAAGSLVAGAGTRLRPQELAAIAATGQDQVACYAPLSVALMSTGDEVLQPGAEFQTGQVYDSNRFLLRALLETVNVTITDLGIVGDDEATVRRTILEASANHDVILTTGGASRGEEDHIVSVMASEGNLHAWQLAVKPGRPLAFGQIGDTVFLGLPGNPVAAFVCFLFYAQPMFAYLQGAVWQAPRRFSVPAAFAIGKKKPDRREFWRAWIEDGKAHKFARDGSGLISGLTAATGLIEVPEEVTSVDEGQMVSFIPFSEFGFV
ncbi:MAG: molybdopterin molybdotransferase MoeA [Alphaproteobacteria bacterium]|nr:molybdopterin molybdotransferase MoeA [Alphaproteobacteria bacterium]